MLKTISKRWLSMTLVFMMLISIIPTIAYAANVNTGVTGLTAESSGAANWSYSGGTITGSVKANKSSGCIGDSFSAQNGTLTFTNGSGATALLSFDYELTLSGGSATVDGAAVTAGATFNKTLEAGGTVAIKITSNATNENATSITISNLKLTEEKDVYVTFNAPTNGSYTVNSEEITAQTVKTFKTTDSVTLAAAAATGYKFFGWYNETTGSYISNNSTFTTSFTENTTVEPKFVSSSAPVFQVGSRLFTDLNEATGYAQSSGIAKIALVANGTLPAGNYTIPSGKTLLIPYDAGHTVCTTSTQVEENNYTTPSVYKKLTMASGANITLDSGASLSVGSKISSQGTSASSHNGTPSGPYGQIEMKTGSSIT
ncbi:MAG: hypothetical protein II711_02780, partial [Clostridia bacterium]|nr:hypothetical protein [Clostridia bacterium]